MFDYLDVTNDPTAERRASIARETVACAVALGFDDIGFIAAIVRSDEDAATGANANSAPVQALVSRVFCQPGGSSLLALTRTKGRDTISLKTLFTDGHVVSTEERPPGIAGKLVSRAITVRPRHQYDLATFPTRDLAELVKVHEARVATALAGERRERGLVPGDLRVYIAMRKRYREIANPRFEAQQRFASRVSWGIFFSLVVLSGVTFIASSSGALGPGFTFDDGSSTRVGLVIAALVLAAICGASAFPVALIVLAPFFVSDAKETPPPRDAESLLALADDVRMGRLPRDAVNDDDEDLAAAGAAGEKNDADLDGRAPRATKVELEPTILAQLRRRDVVLSIASALLLPIVGFALMPVLGTVGPTAALGSVASIDAAVLFIMRRSRVDLLRARFIPLLVEAEGPNASIAPTWLRWVSLAIGVLALFTARRSIARGIDPAPQWLLVQWGFLTGLFIFAAWRSIKRRHARFDGPK